MGNPCNHSMKYVVLLLHFRGEGERGKLTCLRSHYYWEMGFESEACLDIFPIQGKPSLPNGDKKIIWFLPLRKKKNTQTELICLITDFRDLENLANAIRKNNVSSQNQLDRQKGEIEHILYWINSSSLWFSMSTSPLPFLCFYQQTLHSSCTPG